MAEFHTGTINQTVFGREFVKLVWGNENYFEPSYPCWAQRCADYVSTAGAAKANVELSYNFLIA